MPKGDKAGILSKSKKKMELLLMAKMFDVRNCFTFNILYISARLLDVGHELLPSERN